MSYRVFLWHFVCFGMISCASTPEPQKKPEKPRLKAIQMRTILPKHFSPKRIEKEQQSKLLVPFRALKIARVARQTAELREGPSRHFLIKETLLDKGDKVIIQEEVGVWRKVWVPGKSEGGWVHHKTLSSQLGKNGKIEMNPQKLPTVIALRPIQVVYDYRNLKEMAVRISKGTQFVVLKKTAGRNLIWISETNSVAWISADDAN